MNRWRVPTWLILIWTGLCIAWVAAGMSSGGDICAGRVGEDRELCEGATVVGAGIGITFIFVVWFIGFIVLALIWFMTRPRETPMTISQQPTNVGDELTKLATLRDSGTLTSDEFDVQKTRLLAGAPPAPVWGPTSYPGDRMECGRCHKPLSPAWRGKCNHCGAAFADFNPVPRSV